MLQICVHLINPFAHLLSGGVNHVTDLALRKFPPISCSMRFAKSLFENLKFMVGEPTQPVLCGGWLEQANVTCSFENSFTKWKARR